MTAMRRLAVVALAALFSLSVAAVAHADGEAGLVIQHGDGSIDTYCVAFGGDSITGKDLLKRVNIPAEDYGGLVCAVGTNSAEGCFNASSFDSCTCKCSGSNTATCTYWAYFTASYGKSWVYSALGFTQARAKDGDLQAWRWGRGGPNSAPAPPAITFESVCGHAPRGGAAQPADTPPVATLAATVAPQPATSAPARPSPAPTVVVTLPAATASIDPTRFAAAVDTATVTITSHGLATATPPLARSAEAAESSDGKSSLATFGVVAGVFIAAIAVALIWRRRHGN